VIQFGKIQNQIDHTFRHVDKAGFSRADVRAAIQKDLIENMSTIREGLNVRSVNMGGVELDFHAFRLPDGTINIGRITPRR